MPFPTRTHSTIRSHFPIQPPPRERLYSSRPLKPFRTTECSLIGGGNPKRNTSTISRSSFSRQPSLLFNSTLRAKASPRILPSLKGRISLRFLIRDLRFPKPPLVRGSFI